MTTHGLTVDKPIYFAYKNMLARCGYASYVPKKAEYYAGRGITVCDEWRKDQSAFHQWSKSNGWQPGLTLDRIDNDGNYSPENCRWVSIKENIANRPFIRPNAKLTVEQVREIRQKAAAGAKQTALAHEYGVRSSCISRVVTGKRWKFDD